LKNKANLFILSLRKALKLPLKEKFILANVWAYATLANKKP